MAAHPAALPGAGDLLQRRLGAYKGVIPAERHRVCGKESGPTSGVERFNCTLRQRVSRLVRKALSFSKKLANHIGAIKYFICHYNREEVRRVCPALPFEHYQMKNEELARRFGRLATLMEIRGDDKFRVRSYRNAAETIETWPSSVAAIAREEGLKGLQTLPGVGKAISGKIVEILERGTFDAWERLKEETPESVIDLLEVEGVGVKTAATLYQKFKVSSLQDLRAFVEGGGLDLVDGVGEKTAERIRASVARLT